MNKLGENSVSGHANRVIISQIMRIFEQLHIRESVDGIFGWKWKNLL